MQVEYRNICISFTFFIQSYFFLDHLVGKLSYEYNNLDDHDILK